MNERFSMLPGGTGATACDGSASGRVTRFAAVVLAASLEIGRFAEAIAGLEPGGDRRLQDAVDAKGIGPSPASSGSCRRIVDNSPPPDEHRGLDHAGVMQNCVQEIHFCVDDYGPPL